MSRPMWFVKLLKLAFPSRFLMAKVLNRVPVARKLVDYILFRGDDIIYLPKDHVVQVNQAVNQTEELVLPSDVVVSFIERADNLWIMNNCICREAADCQDFPIDVGCLFMGDAVQHINPKLGRRVSRGEALSHITRAREAGLVHMIGRNRLDSVWLGASPSERLLTVCNCCPCCCLWRMLPDLPEDISTNVTRLPGVHVEVTDLCIGCGTCTQGVCFVNAIHVENGRAVITDACRGCGRCVEVCPQQAITLTIDDTAFLPHAVERLSNLVDVTVSMGKQ